MQYRTFGRLDWQPSALGFGAMRLPVIDDDSSQIDEPLATQMIRYAIDHGVDYVDTAYPYHRGESEKFLGRALQDGYRERVHLVTKMPCWRIETAEDFDRYLDEQLTRLQTGRIDFYLLHSLRRDTWNRVRDLGVLAWAEQAMADGRIGHLGFSFHDEYDAFQEIVDGYDNWVLAQVQYNFMDVNYQAGMRGVRYAAERGLAVVVMEPLRGGQIAGRPPEAVARLWASAAQQRSHVEWALQWVWNQPEVSLLLSGMSAMRHVEENVVYAGRSGPGTLTPDELALVDRVREAYRALIPIPCTQCGYCQPCPSGVDIPEILNVYNEATMYENLPAARAAYGWIKKESRADHCIECGECLDKCPQHIPIPDWLKKAHELLSA